MLPIKDKLLLEKPLLSLVQWHTPVILTLESLKQDSEFEAIGFRTFVDI